jgi:hypothetical protein
VSLAGAPAPRFVAFLAMLFHGRFLSALRVHSLGSLTASRTEPAFSSHLGGSVLKGFRCTRKMSASLPLPLALPRASGVKGFPRILFERQQHRVAVVPVDAGFDFDGGGRG